MIQAPFSFIKLLYQKFNFIEEVSYNYSPKILLILTCTKNKNYKLLMKVLSKISTLISSLVLILCAQFTAQSQNFDFLIVNDNPNSNSAYLMKRALNDIGRTADIVDFATHDPLTYSDYRVVLWTAGDNAGQMFNNIPARLALIERATTEKKVWVEGGDVGFRYSSADDNFKTKVLHIKDWKSDATTSSVFISNITHPIFTTPNLIPSSFAFSGNNTADRDAVVLIKNDEGRIRQSAWTGSGLNADSIASINSWSSSPNLTTSHTMFTSFNFAAIADSDVARKLIQNIGTFLLVGDPIPQLVLYNPKDQEIWQRNTTRLIRWGKNKVSLVKIEYKFKGESAWTLIADSVPAFSLDKNGNKKYEVSTDGKIMGSFSWLVPDEDTSAFIKISDLAQMAQTDTNELPFYITSSAPPEWTIHKNALNPQSRTMSTYFELNDTGYVYNFGGNDNFGDNRVQRYNTETGQWIPRTNMPVKASSGVAVSVGNKIYVIGGYNNVDKTLNKVQIYDPSSDAWLTEGVPMPPPVKADFGASVYNNKVYIVGGDSAVEGSAPINKVRVYDPVADSWNEATPFTHSVAKCAVGIDQNRIIVTGGSNRQTFVNFDSVHIGIINPSNPLEIEWRYAGSFPGGAMVRMSAAKVESGLVFVGGDSGYSSNYRGTTYVCMLTDTHSVKAWFPLPEMPTKRSNMGPMLASNNVDSVWAVGGIFNGVQQNKLEALYVPELPAVVAVREYAEGIPSVFSLKQNYPNPFNPATIIRFDIKQKGIATLKLYNLLGQELATLLDEQKEIGSYDVRMNASTYSSGVYFYRLSVTTQSGKIFSETKKMILMK